jgi:hypothetical protein
MSDFANQIAALRKFRKTRELFGPWFASIEPVSIELRLTQVGAEKARSLLCEFCDLQKF